MTTEATPTQETGDEILGPPGLRAFHAVKEEAKALRRALTDLKAQNEADRGLDATRELRHDAADLTQQLQIMTLERDMWAQRCKVNGERARRLGLELEDAYNA